MCRWIDKVFLTGIVLAALFARPGFAQVNLEDRHFIDAQYSKKVSMDFKDAALTDVLKIFSKQSGMNFIAAQDISDKKITLFLENIPVEEALEKILNANGLGYDIQQGSDIFIVRKAADADPVITRVYQLKHATVPMSKVNSTLGFNDSSSSSASSSTSSGTSSGTSSTASTSPSSPSTSGASSDTSSNGIYDAVKAVLTKAGAITQDTRTNSLIITDVTSQFPVIEETIAKLDVDVSQILIEVEMLDISKTTSDLMGVKFGENLLSLKGASKDTYFPFNQSDLLGKAMGPAAPAYTVGKIDASGMTAVVNFLRTQTDTRNLARPRLLTLNNETAEIHISTNEAIGAGTTTTSTTSTVQASFERYSTGVFLTVTPQADLMTREVLMAIYPKVIQARTGGTFGGQQAKDPEERGSRSILKVKDGETIMIGGLIRTDDNGTITKLPVLGDIPFIGMAFRHKNKTGTKRELVIFLTPHIIDSQSGDALLRRDSRADKEMADVPLRSDEIDRALATVEQRRF